MHVSISLKLHSSTDSPAPTSRFSASLEFLFSNFVVSSDSTFHFALVTSAKVILLGIKKRSWRDVLEELFMKITEKWWRLDFVVGRRQLDAFLYA